MQSGFIGHVCQGAYIFRKTIMTDQSGRCDQRPRAGLHAIDRCFNVFMFDLTDNKSRKSPMPLIAMRLNMTLIPRQYTLNSCAMLVAKNIFERDYLFVAAHPQDISRLCRFAHPTSADGGDD